MEFTAKQLDMAVEFVNQSCTIDGGHFEIAREERHVETLQVFQESFWTDEPICKSLGVKWNEEVANVHMKFIQENLTLIAVSDTNAEIMGIRIISTYNKNHTSDPPAFKDDNLNKLFTLLNHVSEMADVYNRCKVTKGFEFVALAVKQKYRKRRLGTKLMSAAVDLVKQLSTGDACIVSLGSSKYTQVIFERLGFDKMYELRYEDYIVAGEKVIGNTGEHEKIVCYAMML